MNPTIGQILQLIITFELGPENLMQNIFVAQLTNVLTSDWSDVLDDVEQYFVDVFGNWMTECSPSSRSQYSTIRLRDVGANQWDTVAGRPFLTLIGGAGGTTSPSPNTGSMVAYPATPRHWGRKGMPPPAEDSLEFGFLTAGALASLGLAAAQWITPHNGLNVTFTPGVYSLASETFRAIQSGILFTDIPGTQVTRKAGRGI